MKNKLSKMILTVMACCLTFTTILIPATATSTDNDMNTPIPQSTSYSLSVEEGNENEYAIHQIVIADVTENGLANFKWGLNGVEKEDDSLEVHSEIIDTLSALASSEQELKKEDVDGLLNENEIFGLLSFESPMSIPAGYYIVRFSDDSWRVLEIKGDYVISVEDKGEGFSGSDKENESNIIPVNPEQPEIEDEKIPVVTMKVKQGDDKFAKAVDAGIGDEIIFELTSTLPSDFDLYQNYYYKFENVLSEGLTYVEDSVKITAGIILDEEDFNVSYDKNILSIEIPDFKNIACINPKGIVSVTYKAIVNKNVKTGSDGVNKNSVNLYFSDKGLMTTEDFYTVERGEMEVPVNVIEGAAVSNVYSYQLAVRYVDKDGNELENGGFSLEKKIGEDEWKRIGEEMIGSGENGDVFEWKRIDSGEYRLVQTKIPYGYSGIEPAEFIIDASMNEDGLLKVLGVAVHVESGLFDHSASPADGMITGKIGSSKMVTLPKTGKMDVVVWYGSVMMLFAAAMILHKRLNKDA